jgi:hypothetical protein
MVDIPSLVIRKRRQSPPVFITRPTLARNAARARACSDPYEFA